MPSPSRALLTSIAALASAIPLFRPGAPVPGASAPLAGAPPLDGASSGRRAATGALRKSLRVSVVEGIFAEVVGACAGATVVTAWALHLGAGAPVIGVITALPYLAQFVQFPAAWLTSRFGARRMALLAVGASRQVYFPLALLPFLAVSAGAQQVVLVLLAGAAQVLGVIGNNAWVSWMGDLVPKRVRGRYFGKRTAVYTLGGTLAGVAVGVLLDHARGSGDAGQFLSLLSLTACAVGALTTWLMTQQHDPVAGRPPEQLSIREAFRTLANPEVRPLLAYQLAWNAAVGIASGFFVLHMVVNLEMGFALVAAHAAAIGFVRLLVAPLWGRLIDRFGSQPVLAVVSFGIALPPLIWLFPTPDFLWPILLDVVFAGVLWGGHGLAVFALPLAVAPSRGRPFYLAAFSTAGGLAYAAAAMSAGALTRLLPEHFVLLNQPFAGLQVLFVVSAAARLGAAFLSLKIVELGAARPAEVLQVLRNPRRLTPAEPLRRVG